MQHTLTIYTDGSSLGNPGPGGWGALIISKSHLIELGGLEEYTTNNRMELQALIEAFEYVAQSALTDGDITVYADSKYVLDGLDKWSIGWKRRGWKKADGKSVLNKELWQRLDGLKTFLEADNKLFLHHVAAHTGEEHNERVDDIARGFAEGKNVSLYEGSLAGYNEQ